MTFSDDDLKLLKEYIENNPEPSEWFEAQKALLARLEAAEAVCLQAKHQDWCKSNFQESSCDCEMPTFLEAWRKAKGEAV